MIDDKDKTEGGDDWMDVFDTFHSLFRRKKANEMKAKNLFGFFGGAGGATDEDAQAFFDRMSAAGNPVPDADKPHWNNFFVDLKSTPGEDGVTSHFDSMDFFTPEAIYSKGAAIVNILSDNYHGTINNDYVGSFTAYLGLKGNGTDFDVTIDYNPFDGGTYKYKTNDACAGVLIMTDAAETGIDMAGMNAAANAGTYIRSRTISGSGYDFQNMVNGPQALVTNPTTPYAYGWFDVRKSASGTSQQYINGFLVGQATGLANDNTGSTDWIEFAAFTTVKTLWTTRTHGARYAGSSNIIPSVLHGLFYKNILKPLGLTAAKVGKRILSIGDSMTGDLGTTSLSAISEYTRRICTNLNTVPNGWVVAQNGIANRGWGTTPLVANGLNSIIPSQVVPFRNTNYDKDIIVAFAGTNDIANQNISGAACKALIDTGIAMLNAVGFPVIIVGVIDRNASFTNGQTQAGFDTERAALRTLMLAAYPTATPVTNVYTDGTNYYIDTFNNAKFANAADTTYFNADTIHLNATGYDALADELITPAIELI